MSKYRRRRAAIVAVALASGAMAMMIRPALADQTWDGGTTGGLGGGSGTWNSANTNWNPGDAIWGSQGATFGGSAGTVTLVGPLTATGLTFNTGGYTLSSSTTGNILTLASPGGGATPIINVGAGMSETFGQFVSEPTAPPDPADNLELGGTSGFVLTGGGTFLLANPLGMTGGTITVNNGSTLTAGEPSTIVGASGVVPTQFLNGNALTLNGGNYYVNTTNSVFSAANPNQNVGAITIGSGTSTIWLARGNTAASSSIKFANSSVTLMPGSQFNLQTGGNTNSNNPIFTFGSATVMPTTGGSSTTIDAVEYTLANAMGSTGTEHVADPPANNQTTAGLNGVFGTNFVFTSMVDNGNSVNFISGGDSTRTGDYVQITSSIAATTVCSGTWTLGNPNGTQGLSVQLLTTSSSQNQAFTGGITSGSITVNPYSQLAFGGNGLNANQAEGELTYGTSGQTITINGIGTELADFTAGTSGALFFTSLTTSATGIAAKLEANVVMATASIIDVATGTNGATTAQIDGTITGTGPLGKSGASTLILNNGGNNWTGGTNITNGTVVVNVTNALSSTIGPVTLASSSATSPTSTNLTLNAAQTIGSLSSSFVATSGTASNTVVINGTNLNIVQTTPGSVGPGQVPATLTSTIKDGATAGSLSLDAASTSTLTLASGNSYSNGTTINGGALLVTNTSGSGTGGGNVTVNGGKFGGNGSITGTVQLNGGDVSPGTSLGLSHLTGTLTLGGLSLSGGSLDFSLNTSSSSDEISLINTGGANIGNINFGSTASPVLVNLTNLGGLSFGTYHLIAYAGSESGLFSNLTINTATEPTGFGLTLHDDPNSVDLVVTTPPPKTWNVGNGNWDINTSSNWTGGTSTKFFNGDFVIFSDTNPGGSTIAVNIPADVSPGSVQFTNNTKNYTVGGTGAIAGTTNVEVGGTGTVTLTSTNSFKGVVSVDGGGTLSISADNQLGNAANGLSLLSNSASPLSTLQASSTFSSARGMTLFNFGGAVDVTGTNTLTMTGSLGGAGGLTKSNSGTLILAPSGAANAYNGPTMVSGGALVLGTTGATPSGSALTVAMGATFDTQTFNNGVGSIAGAGNIKIGNGAILTTGLDNTNTTFSGSITGNSGAGGTLTKIGAGTLTLTGTNSFSGGLKDLNGGAIVGGTGNLGAGPITIANTSTLNLTTSFDFTGTPLSVGTSGGNLIAPSGAAITLPTLAGTGALTVTGGNVTITSNSTTSGGNTGGINLGSSTDGGDTLILDAVDATGTPGTGTGHIALSNGSTLVQNGIGIGFNSDGTINQTGGGIGTLTFNGNVIWQVMGTSAYSAGSPTMALGATLAINIPNSTDQLKDNTAWRGTTAGTFDPDALITITGNGLYQMGSGAITTTTYNGSWQVNMGASGRFVMENVPGGTGETLNSPGYTGTASNSVTNAISVTGGTIALGADSTNPNDSTPPKNAGGVNIDSFRSPFSFTGGGVMQIASTGYEYNPSFSASATSGPATIYFTNTPVSANVSGNITIGPGSTLTVLTYDPINNGTYPAGTPSAGQPTATTGSGGARNINFNTDGVVVPGNFTWNDDATIIVDPGSTIGGQASFGRTSGTVSVGNNDTLQINSGSIVNIGFIPGVTAVSGIDPLTDNTGANSASVSVVDNGSIVWGGRTALVGDAGLGIKTYQVASLAIGSGANAVLNQADTHTDRTVLITPAVSFVSPTSGKLDLKDNDLIVPAGNLAAITADLAHGIGSGNWNSSAGITSSVAAAKTNTALGVEVNDDGKGTGTPLMTTFDGQVVSDGDVLVKYTYYGDANLDGVVNGSDYTLIDNAYNIKAPATWRDGDFNYDGKINGDDYMLIDNSFNTEGSTSFAATPAGPAEMIATNTSEIAGESSSAVPEPGSLTLLTIGAGGLLSRRRRRTVR